MAFASWLRSLNRHSQYFRAKRKSRRAAHRKSATGKLCVEKLEHRTLLSPYIVTTTADSGPGSLRDAITQCNLDTSHSLYTSPTDPTRDEIDFNITAASDTGGGYDPVTGVATIRPTAVPITRMDGPPTGLPEISNPVIINGYSQPRASRNTLVDDDNALLKIELEGSAAGEKGVGLVVGAGNSAVQGLVINRFAAFGIWLDPDNNGNTVAGNFIGTDVTGTLALSNSTGPGFFANIGLTHNAAVFVNGSYNLIGGSDPWSRNLISGNRADGILVQRYNVPIPTGNRVQGNFIGTNVHGNEALGNGANDIYLHGGQETTIGGTSQGERNIIAAAGGNSDFAYNDAGVGIAVGGDYTIVQGNFVGTDVTGRHPLGNRSGGIGVGFADHCSAPRK